MYHIPQLRNDEFGCPPRKIVVDSLGAGHRGAGRGFLGGTADVGGHQDIFHIEEGVVQVERLLFHGIQAGPGDLLGLQGPDEGGFIYNGPPGLYHQHLHASRSNRLLSAAVRLLYLSDELGQSTKRYP